MSKKEIEAISLEKESAPADEKVPTKGPNVPKDAVFSDYGNALRVQFYFASLIFFHHAEKVWFRWTGSHWKRDTNQSVTLLVIDAIRNMLTTEIPWLKYFKKKNPKAEILFPDIEFVEKSLSRSKIRAAGLLAADLMPLSAQLDIYKFYLNCKNGTIDLPVGKLLEHDREHYLTKIVPHDYKKGAECPRFKAFLERAFPNNAKGIRFLQKIFGYALTGDVSEKKIFIFWGAAGNNGKSLLFNVFRGILGPHFCIQLSSESLVSGRINSIRSDLAKLKGFRFVTTAETDRRYKFNEPLLKLMTGGDAITARHPHERETEYTPEFSLFIGTNFKLEFTLSDKAMTNRVCIVPFRVSIPEKEQDKGLTEYLINNEAEGILAWAVEGARLWKKEGLGENPFDQEDATVITPVVTMEQFVNECCTQNKGDKESSENLLNAFNAFKELKGDETDPVNVKVLSNLLKDFHTEVKHGRDGNYREGIALNDFGNKLLAGDSSDTESKEDQKSES